MNTVLGSNAPPLTVNLLRVFRSGSKDTLLTESQVKPFSAFFYLVECISILLSFFCIFLPC